MRDIIQQKENEKNLEIEKIKRKIEEASFKRREQDITKRTAQSRCKELVLAVDKLKRASTELENSIPKLIQYKEEYVEGNKKAVGNFEMLQDSRNDNGVLQLEEYKELLEEQAKRMGTFDEYYKE